MSPVYEPSFPGSPFTSLARLLAEVPWARRTGARSECFMASEPTSYRYGKGVGARDYESVPFAAGVDVVLAGVNVWLNERGWGPMTGCFLNHYANDHEALGWHADDFVGMDHTRPVVSVSYGEPREIWWRSNETAQMDAILRQETPERRVEKQVLGGDGSIFVMPPGFQHAYQHRIPKGSRAMGPRVSLTFRAFGGSS